MDFWSTPILPKGYFGPLWTGLIVACQGNGVSSINCLQNRQMCDHAKTLVLGWTIHDMLYRSKQGRLWHLKYRKKYTRDGPVMPKYKIHYVYLQDDTSTLYCRMPAGKGLQQTNPPPQARWQDLPNFWLPDWGTCRLRLKHQVQFEYSFPRLGTAWTLQCRGFYNSPRAYWSTSNWRSSFCITGNFLLVNITWMMYWEVGTSEVFVGVNILFAL